METRKFELSMNAVGHTAISADADADNLTRCYNCSGYKRESFGSMVTIHLKGQVTPDGQLVFDVPDDLPPGEVNITLEIPNTDEQFTEEEINELLTFKPSTGAEIVAAGLMGGWEDMNITDPVAWGEEQRRKQREQKGW